MSFSSAVVGYLASVIPTYVALTTLKGLWSTPFLAEINSYILQQLRHDVEIPFPVDHDNMHRVKAPQPLVLPFLYNLFRSLIIYWNLCLSAPIRKATAKYLCLALSMACCSWPPVAPMTLSLPNILRSVAYSRSGWFPTDPLTESMVSYINWNLWRYHWLSAPFSCCSI